MSHAALRTLLAAAALIGASCGGDAAIEPEPACAALARAHVPSDTNVVLVVNDTMRRDRLGAYGGPARTPAFDAFAAGNLLFERAFSQAPWTVPSIATLFTGLHPSQHGVESHPQGHVEAHAPIARRLRASDVLGEGFATLPEALRDAGLHTGAFIANPWLDSRFGFAQGFERYDDSFARWGVPGAQVARAALDWIASLPPDARFFAYVHTIDSHRPYGPLRWADVKARTGELQAARGDTLPAHVREEIAPLVQFAGEGAAVGTGLERSLPLLRMAYDVGVERFDAALAELLAGLAAHPAWERTAVVVTSDHGEALYDRGYGNHGNGLYADEIAVPLAARLPGVEPARGRIACAVGLVDLMPTLCDYTGARCPEATAGASWLARGEPRWIVAEGVMHKPRHRSIRNASYLLLWEPAGAPDRPTKPRDYALYDLRADPDARRDLLVRGQATPESERVAEHLAERLAAAVPPFDRPPPETAPIDPELRERLEQLGYGDDP